MKTYQFIKICDSDLYKNQKIFITKKDGKEIEVEFLKRDGMYMLFKKENYNADIFFNKIKSIRTEYKTLY